MTDMFEQRPPILSSSKDTRGIRPEINRHRACFDKLSMSGNCK